MRESVKSDLVEYSRRPLASTLVDHDIDTTTLLSLSVLIDD